MLERLKELATDISPRGRGQLLHAVTDLFLIDKGPSPTAKNLYTEIADYSLEQMPKADRVTYAKRVAPQSTLPPAVARRLAEDDDIAIAKLVLKLSPVLSDQDLTEIASARSQSHLAAIAERESLSEMVTKALVERGDETVLRSVSGNRGAKFSSEGLFRLIERGRADPHVSRNLVGRADQLPPEQATRVRQMAKVPEPKAPETKRPPSANEATPAAQRTEMPPAPSRGPTGRRVDAKVLIGDIREKKRSLDDVIKMLAEQDRAFDLAQVLSTFAGIPNAQVLKALLEPDADSIAESCRAVNLAPEAFRAILDLRVTRLNCPPKQIERDLEAYAEKSKG